MVRITLPSFWDEDPGLWFAKIDAIFALNEVSSKEKYNYVITELDKPFLVMAKNVILQPYDKWEDKYINLKNELIKRISISQLEKETFDEEQKPSEFYEHIKNKADRRVSDDMIKKIWINGLPKHIKDIITVDCSEDIELQKKMADKVMGTVKNPKDLNELKATVSKSFLENNMDVAHQVITLVLYVLLLLKFKVDMKGVKEDLGKFLSVLFENFMHRDQNMSKETVRSILNARNDGQSTSTLKEDTENGEEESQNQQEEEQKKVQLFCWYHTNWGTYAHQCCPPCNFKEFQHSDSD